MERAVGRAVRLLPVLPCPAAPSSGGWTSPGGSEGALQPRVTKGLILRCRWFPVKSGATGARGTPRALALPNGFKAFPSPSPLPREGLGCPQAPPPMSFPIRKLSHSHGPAPKPSQAASITFSHYWISSIEERVPSPTFS